MRLIVFAVTLFTGVYVSSFFTAVTPCGNSDSYRYDVKTIYSKPFKYAPVDTSNNYTKEEAVALIGTEVRNLSHLNAKCPKESGDCLNLSYGETGRIVGLIPSLNNTYMLEIQWNQKQDAQNGGYVSYVGKELSFQIIK